ncbi:MAG: hypothetical protein JO208_14525 [Alphaproteobacteria bacterium]|nr:hypothetical protein [Alphaproteobacteria bacterium]
MNIFQISDEKPSVFDSYEFRDTLLYRVADHVGGGRLLPIAKAQLGKTEAHDPTLFLTMFQFTQSAVEDLRRLGRVCPEETPIPFLLVFAHKKRMLRLLKKMTKNCWIFGNSQCAISYPLEDDHEATDKFLQVIADVHATELPEADDWMWGDYVTQSVFEKKPRVISS